jgi:Lipocalin-like domain
MPPNLLVGTWRLVACEARSADGRVRYPWGPRAVGYLLYTADGFMAVNIMSAGRPRFAADDITGASDAEKARAAETYAGYCGTYEVRGQTVVHHVAVSFFPNWIGERKRLIALEGDRLTLSSRPRAVGGQEETLRVVWERVRPSEGLGP